MAEWFARETRMRGKRVKGDNSVQKNPIDSKLVPIDFSSKITAISYIT